MNTIDPNTHRERGSSPAARALRGIRERAKRRRSGIAIIQILMYAALVAAIIGAALGGPALYRQIVGGSEQNTLKGNIDRVAQASEDYWQQFAADRDGRRKIDLLEFCNYANSQFGQGEDITLRTMAVVAGAAIAAPTDSAITDGLADGLATTASSTDQTATCAAAVGDIDAPGYYDILVSDGGTMLVSAAATTPNNYMAAGTVKATGAAAAVVSLEDLEAAGLASTRGVWMMQPIGTLTVPAGAQIGATANQDLNEILIFGGVAADGTSFCIVKVFDADDRAAIGEYRSARQSGLGAAVGENPFATCTSAVPGTGANSTHLNAGWPEAR